MYRRSIRRILSETAQRTDIEFKINYISPLGSFATWKSTKQTGSYDLRTFEIHALPVEKVEGLRPGMSVLYQLP